MAGTSSLLKSAAATRKKVQAQEDALVAFEWQNSAQTYEEFVEYSNYLQNRQNGVSDPSQALSYARNLVSARRSYTSNEIQRTQMAIMEGRASTEDKLNTVRDLFFQAQDNGDYNLAQNLMSQYDSLSIKLQNEIDTAQKAFSASGSKAKGNFLKSLENGAVNVTLPDGTQVTPLAVIKDRFQETGDTVRALQAAQETMDAIRNTIVDQYNNATTQDEIDKLEQKYGAGLENLNEELKVNIGGKNLSAQQVVNGLANDQYNNPQFGIQAQYNEATGKTDYKLKENAIDKIDYIRQFNQETGQEEYVPLQVRTDQDKLMFGQSDQGRGLNTQITNEGQVIGGKGEVELGTGKVKRDESQTIGNRLKELGIQAKQNGTTLVVKLPGENIERIATIQPNGSIRYMSDAGDMVEVGLVDRNLGTNDLPQQFKAGEQRIVSPDEISDFGTQSAFGGTQSQASEQGKRYISSILGQSRINDILPGDSDINVGNDFRGLGGAVMGANVQGGTSGVLQTAGNTRKAIELQQQRQQMLQTQAEAAARLQATPTFDLNQTPVQQLAANGVMRRQLQVAAPRPTARVVVAPPAPTPRITKVSVATPGRISGVSNNSFTGRVTVR